MMRVRIMLSAVMMVSAASSAFTQNDDEGKKPAPKKVAAEKKSASAVKPGQYSTEAAAQAGCKGATVVWTDSDNFNHYKGSREYGKKPGAFVCEK